MRDGSRDPKQPFLVPLKKIGTLRASRRQTIGGLAAALGPLACLAAAIGHLALLKQHYHNLT